LEKKTFVKVFLYDIMYFAFIVCIRGIPETLGFGEYKNFIAKVFKMIKWEFSISWYLNRDQNII